MGMGPDFESLLEIIKLDHTGLSGWARSPMTSGKARGKEPKAVWRQRRDWSDVATSQGSPEPPDAGGGEEQDLP